MSRRVRLALTLIVGLGLGGPVLAGDFYLKDGDRVVFYGDSITDQRLYTTFVETFAVTRFPERNVTFVHSGWSGDRVTGGGGGPIDRRLFRDVIPYRPTVVTVMLGMNDGSYRSFDEKVFETYSKGYEHLVQTLKRDLPGLRLTLIVPSPFDDVTREPKFEGGYNKIMLRFGEFIKDLADREKADVADLNTSVVESLRKADQTDESLAEKIINDRVHPGPGGHLLMAAALLRAWGAPATVTAVAIDAEGARVVKADQTRVVDLAGCEGRLCWTQTDDALPMPIDMSDPVTALAVHSSDVVKDLNQETLKVRGLDRDEYTLTIDGDEVGTFKKDQLAEGINLAEHDTPMSRQARAVHALTLRHNNIHFLRWRQVQVPLERESSTSLTRALADLDDYEAEVVHRQRHTARPLPRHYELAPK
jgi:lysophospholipase L1-like esterase